MSAADAIRSTELGHFRVAVLGAGFAGLGMAIRLKQNGSDDFVVFERADDVGGTWRDNTYPGAACDVPSHLYSFSFAPNPNWSESFSGQREIQQYLRHCADRFGVRSHIRFSHTVEALRWDDDAQRWRIATSAGDCTAQFVVNGMGALSEPSIPEIPGLKSFPGTVFHSARWRHDHDLHGEHVAVVGTGASAIQFLPQITDGVAQLDLYQRTPPWVIPRVNRRITGAERWLFNRFPVLQRLYRAAIYWGREAYVFGFTGPRRLMRIPERIARAHLQRQVPDPGLREQLTPDYTIGCKRILIANDYYPALARPNVTVVDSGVSQIRGSTIVAADGTERPADTIIFGTGFHVTDYPAGEVIWGRGGQRLADAWRDGMEAYRGTTVSGFPNLFLLTGPNTGLGHSSMVYMIEAQLNYVIDALRRMDRQGMCSFDVRSEAQRTYNRGVQQRMRNTVWTTGGCVSWYLDDTGRNTSLWPDFTWRFARQTRRFDAAAYAFRRRGQHAGETIDLPQPLEADGHLA